MPWFGIWWMIWRLVARAMRYASESRLGQVKFHAVKLLSAVVSCECAVKETVPMFGADGIAEYALVLEAAEFSQLLRVRIVRLLERLGERVAQLDRFAQRAIAQARGKFRVHGLGWGREQRLCIAIAAPLCRRIKLGLQTRGQRVEVPGVRFIATHQHHATRPHVAQLALDALALAADRSCERGGGVKGVCHVLNGFQSASRSWGQKDGTSGSMCLQHSLRASKIAAALGFMLFQWEIFGRSASSNFSTSLAMNEVACTQ